MEGDSCKQLYASATQASQPCKPPPRKGEGRAAKAGARLHDGRCRSTSASRSRRSKTAAMKLETVPFATQIWRWASARPSLEQFPGAQTGRAGDKGPEVPRGVLTVLKTAAFRIDPRHSGRLELAHWIASKDNPLTARVMVNRVWEHLFGQGWSTPSTISARWQRAEPSRSCSTCWPCSS